MGKLVSIQWLRGIAAIAVVWFHAMFLISNNGLHSYQTEYGQIRQIGSIGVDIFFVISGFIVSISAARAPSVGAFLRNRLVRIWPLYAAATLLYLVVRPDRTDAVGIAMSLLFLQPPGGLGTEPTLPPGWTLLFEMAFYLILACALMWRSPRSLQERVAIIVVSLVVIGSAYGFVRPFNIIGNPINLEFLMGVLIGRIWASGYRLPPWAAASLFGLGAFFILRDAMHGIAGDWGSHTTLDGSMSWQRAGTWGVYSALVVASAALRHEIPQGTGRILTFFGDASYSIYLFHMHVLDWLLHRLALFGEMSPDRIIWSATAIAVLAGVIAHVILEWPLMQAAKGLRARFAGRIGREHGN